MNTCVIHTVASLRPVATKHGPRWLAKLQVLDEPQREVWLSPRQAAQLEKCMGELNRHGGYSTKHAECHAMFDDDRFVWCGIHSGMRSDLPWLAEKFGVTFTPAYTKMAAAPVGPDESLIDD